MDQPGWDDDPVTTGVDSTSSTSSYIQVLLYQLIYEDSSDPDHDHEMIALGESSSDEAPLIVNASKVELEEMLIDDVDEGDVIVKERVVLEETFDGEESSDLDLQEEHDQGRRYFLENSGPKCFNCDQAGHMSRDCPLESKLPCFLCGVCGHQRNRCPEEICYNCNRPGHQSRDCKLPRKRRMHSGDYCARCRHPGHLAKDCSLNWRQYRFAVKQLPRDEDALWRDFRRIDRCCYNCAALDHFGDECPQRRKRPEWSIFHEPDLRFLRMTLLSSTKGSIDVVRESVAAVPKKGSSPPKSKSFNGRARDERDAKRAEGQSKKEQTSQKPKESPRKPSGNSSSNSSRTAEPAKKQHRRRIEEDGSNYYQVVNDGTYHGPRRRSRSPPRRPPSGQETGKGGGTYKGGYKK